MPELWFSHPVIFSAFVGIPIGLAFALAVVGVVEIAARIRRWVRGV